MSTHFPSTTLTPPVKTPCTATTQDICSHRVRWRWNSCRLPTEYARCYISGWIGTIALLWSTVQRGSWTELSSSGYSLSHVQRIECCVKLCTYSTGRWLSCRRCSSRRSSSAVSSSSSSRHFSFKHLCSSTSLPSATITTYSTACFVTRTASYALAYYTARKLDPSIYCNTQNIWIALYNKKKPVSFAKSWSVVEI